MATLEESKKSLQSTKSFSKSKRLLAAEVYTEHLFAFYSGCRYRLYQKKLIPVKSSCGFKYRKNQARSERIEWEHIVPAWHFGHQLRCWQDGGRKDCSSGNEQFREMEADMHNLVPAIGEINGDRSNFKYGIVANEPRVYGNSINMEVDFKARTVEPPENVMGDIARTYFYMADRYQLQISDQQQKLFIAWNNMDPADDWEREKNQRVAALQKTENKYITHYKKLKQGDIVVSTPDTNFDSIASTLRERFGFLFDSLPAQIAEALILIGAAFVAWLNRRKKKLKVEEDNSSELTRTFDDFPSASQGAPESPAEHSPEAEHEADYLKIRLSMNNEVLSIENDSQLVVEKSSRGHAQRWVLIDTNKTEGFVFIKHLETDQVLAIENGLRQDGAPVVLEKKRRRSNDHQEWKLIGTGTDGEVLIENRETGLVLGATGHQNEIASVERQSTDEASQCWRIG